MTDQTQEAVTIATMFPLTINGGKGDNKWSVSFESLPDASLAHAVMRGLQEDLNNAGAGLGDDPAKAAERREAVATKYRNADFTRASGERGPVDTVEGVAAQIARETLNAMIKAANEREAAQKLPVTKYSKDQKAAMLAALIKRDGDDFTKRAKARLDERKAAAGRIIEKSGDDILASLGITPKPAE